jgi:L-arabinose isomerase
MINLKELEIWFITSSQDLYGPKVLEQVAKNSKEIATFFNSSAKIPVSIVYKSVMRSPDEITNVCVEANSAAKCIGVITWCHTFSPSKMWINGLKILNKPMLQLHTQYNRDLPWADIDMNFMNLNQAAHGDREHGFILSRLRKNRKVVVGYWKEDDVQERIGVWSRAAAAW